MNLIHLYKRGEQPKRIWSVDADAWIAKGWSKEPDSSSIEETLAQSEPAPTALPEPTPTPTPKTKTKPSAQ